MTPFWPAAQKELRLLLDFEAKEQMEMMESALMLPEQVCLFRRSCIEHVFDKL